MYDVTHLLWTLRDHIRYGIRNTETTISALRVLNDIPIDIPGPEMLMIQQILEQLPKVSYDEHFTQKMPDSWCNWDEPSSYEE